MIRDWILFSWLCRFPGEEPSPNTWAGFIVFTKANAKCASMTMLIWMCRCLRECSIGDALGTNEEAARKHLVTLFEAMGPTDPRTIDARRKLSAMLFS